MTTRQMCMIRKADPPSRHFAVGDTVMFAAGVPAPDGWDVVPGSEFTANVKTLDEVNAELPVSGFAPYTGPGTELGVCDECWRENPGVMHDAIPLGTRCERHGGAQRGRKWRSTPNGPDDVVFDLNANVAPEVFAIVDDTRRWHEIATEGLPSETHVGEDFWLYGEMFSPRPMLAQFDGRAMSCPWDPYEDLGRVVDQEITHWQLAIVPAPPTKEPR